MFKLSVCLVSNEIEAHLAIPLYWMFEKWEYWVGGDGLAAPNTVREIHGGV
jgi:hypothetical protein